MDARRPFSVVEPNGAGMTIEILEACSSVRIVARTGADRAGWVVAAADSAKGTGTS